MSSGGNLTFFISSIFGRRQWSRKSVQLQLNCADLCLDSDIRKGYDAGVCLQADKARVGIDARRIPSNRIGRAAPKPSRFLAVVGYCGGEIDRGDSERCSELDNCVRAARSH